MRSGLSCASIVVFDSPPVGFLFRFGKKIADNVMVQITETQVVVLRRDFTSVEDIPITNIHTVDVESKELILHTLQGCHVIVGARSGDSERLQTMGKLIEARCKQFKSQGGEATSRTASCQSQRGVGGGAESLGISGTINSIRYEISSGSFDNVSNQKKRSFHQEVSPRKEYQPLPSDKGTGTLISHENSLALGQKNGNGNGNGNGNMLIKTSYSIGGKNQYDNIKDENEICLKNTLETRQIVPNRSAIKSMNTIHVPQNKVGWDQSTTGDEICKQTYGNIVQMIQDLMLSPEEQMERENSVSSMNTTKVATSFPSYDSKMQCNPSYCQAFKNSMQLHPRTLTSQKAAAAATSISGDEMNLTLTGSSYHLFGNIRSDNSDTHTHNESEFGLRRKIRCKSLEPECRLSGTTSVLNRTHNGGEQDLMEHSETLNSEPINEVAHNEIDFDKLLMPTIPLEDHTVQITNSKMLVPASNIKIRKVKITESNASDPKSK